MSDIINRKALDDKAEGFWNKHKWCVIGSGCIALGCFICGWLV